MELEELGEVVFESQDTVVVYIGETLGAVAQRDNLSPVAFHEKHLEWGVHAQNGDYQRFEKSGLEVGRLAESLVLEADGGGWVQFPLETAKTVLAEIAD